HGEPTIGGTRETLHAAESGISRGIGEVRDSLVVDTAVCAAGGGNGDESGRERRDDEQDRRDPKAQAHGLFRIAERPSETQRESAYRELCFGRQTLRRPAGPSAPEGSPGAGPAVASVP